MKNYLTLSNNLFVDIASEPDIYFLGLLIILEFFAI